MELRTADYERLISDTDIDVMDELIRLNQLVYGHALDVIQLAREINLKRIISFLKQTQVSF